MQVRRHDAEGVLGLELQLLAVQGESLAGQGAWAEVVDVVGVDGAAGETGVVTVTVTMATARDMRVRRTLISLFESSSPRVAASWQRGVTSRHSFVVTRFGSYRSFAMHKDANNEAVVSA